MKNVSDLALEELKERVKAAGSQTAAAKELGISLSQLNEVLNGRRDLSKSMLEKIGYDRVVVHVKKQNKSKLLQTLVTFGQSARRD